MATSREKFNFTEQHDERIEVAKKRYEEDSGKTNGRGHNDKWIYIARGAGLLKDAQNSEDERVMAGKTYNRVHTIKNRDKRRKVARNRANRRDDAVSGCTNTSLNVENPLGSLHLEKLKLAEKVKLTWQDASKSVSLTTLKSRECFNYLVEKDKVSIFSYIMYLGEMCDWVESLDREKKHAMNKLQFSDIGEEMKKIQKLLQPAGDASVEERSDVQSSVNECGTASLNENENTEVLLSDVSENEDGPLLPSGMKKKDRIGRLENGVSVSALGSYPQKAGRVNDSSSSLRNRGGNSDLVFTRTRKLPEKDNQELPEVHFDLRHLSDDRSRKLQLPSPSGYSLQGKKRMFTDVEWQKVLMRSYLCNQRPKDQLVNLDSDGWSRIIKDTGVSTSKSGEDIMADFFSHCVPNIEQLDMPGEKTPLELDSFTDYAFMTIYHSVEKVQKEEILRVIENLIERQILSDKIPSREWWCKFWTRVVDTGADKAYEVFNTSSDEFKKVKMCLLGPCYSPD